MRIVVFAYHNVGHDCLKYLIENNEEIAAVFTHRDNTDEEIFFRSVAELARQNHIPCYFPEDISEPKWAARIREIAPDIIFSFYYRLMIPGEILSIPKLGAMNMHGSLLPKYRGRCPVNWVIINGETETGVTLHYMVENPDAGDIVAQKKVQINFEDTAYTLMGKIEKAAVQLLQETWPLIKEGRHKRIKQDLSRGSYFGGRKPEDGLIDWKKRSIEVYNLIRAVTHPYPGAFTFYGDRKVFIWKVAIVEGPGGAGTSPGSILIKRGELYVQTGDGLLQVLRAQVEGCEELSGREFIESLNVNSGASFRSEVLK
jgi:methionyl-tRNA formyltransferase